jgi:serine/threonine protein kinase/WD40 repeat protein/cell division protein FtsB
MDLSGRTLGEFRLRKLIGEGGHGMIYLAEQAILGREVVVKVLREERDSPDARERFLREARLAAQLRHLYAAQVYAFGTADGGSLMWIAMELVDGITLAEWLATHGTMSLGELVPFFEQLAEVVDAMHQCGMVHRDLKPANVMVVEGKGPASQGRLIPKLLDFGIAKGSAALSVEDHKPIEVPAGDRVVTALIRAKPAPRRREPTKTSPRPVNVRRRGLTLTGAGFGSRLYMSPEQWGNASGVGPAADIYSLGIMIYEALTGRVPFVASSTDDLIRKHCYETVPPLGGGFSPELDQVFSRALAKRPEARHRNVLELAAELRAVLHADPHEQLRSLAQRWQERGRSPDLLARGGMLADLERIAHRPRVAASLGDLECSFVAESQRRIRHIRWAKRALVAAAVMAVIGWFLYRAAMQAQLAQEQTQLAQEQASSARKVTEATVRQSELEQGNSALLDNDSEAPIHLARAYKLGDHSPSTEFMLARALQPMLAEQARFKSSYGRMWSAAFSPDGRQVITTDDRDAQVRDAQTGKLLFTLPHGNEVYQAVYSSDGRRIVTVTGNAVRVWHANNGSLEHKLSDGRSPEYFVTAISHDGKFVAAINLSGSMAHVWDASTGAMLAELHNDPMDFPTLAFSPDGHWLATTGGNDVRIFDTRTWVAVLTIRGPRIRSMAFDPTGTRIITGALTGDASIWSIPGGARIQHLRDGKEPVDVVAFSPDAQLAVTGSRGGEVQVWRTGSGELQSQVIPRQGKILAIEFDRASKLIVSTCADGAVIVLDAYLGISVSEFDDMHSVLVAHFDPSSRRVVGASLDGTAQVWDVTSPYRRWSSPPVSDDCNLSPTLDGRFVAVDCREHATRVWDTANAQLVAELPSAFEIAGDFLSASSVVSSAGDRAAIPRGNTLEVYELPNGRLLRTIAHGESVSAVAFAATGRDLVSGAIDGSLIVTRDDGTRLSLPTSSGGIDTIMVLPDDRVITADAQRRLRVYDQSGVVLAD